MLPSVDGWCPFLLEANWHHHITSKLTFSELRTILFFTCHGPIYTIIVVGHLHIYIYIYMYVRMLHTMYETLKKHILKKKKHKTYNADIISNINMYSKVMASTAVLPGEVHSDCADCAGTQGGPVFFACWTWPFGWPELFPKHKTLKPKSDVKP